MPVRPREGQTVAAAGRAVRHLVAPQLSRYWTDDPECVDGAHEKVETHLFHDVIPTSTRPFAPRADRQGRIFAGMSAGGYCALNLGLRHPTRWPRSSICPATPSRLTPAAPRRCSARTTRRRSRRRRKQPGPATLPPRPSSRRCESGSTAVPTTPRSSLKRPLTTTSTPGSPTGLAGPTRRPHLLGLDIRDAPSVAVGSEHTEVRCLEGFATRAAITAPTDLIAPPRGPNS